MSQKIPCEVVRDLLPSYIDELTSEVTNRIVRDHLEGCEECRKVYGSMTGSLTGEEEKFREQGEIDFLRKNRKRNRRIVLGSIAGAVLIVLGVLLARTFFIGSANYSNWTAENLTVNDRQLDFVAVPADSASAISKLSFDDENGVVTVRARSVAVSPFHTGSLGTSFTASETIRDVWLGDRIVWSEGETVSPLASDLFTAHHSYVGDMSANNRLANALRLSSYVGPFTNELETDKEPYGWRILLSDPIPDEKLARKEQNMDTSGRIIVGLIENLDHVTFVYTADGTKHERTVTAADASAFFGEDIKNCGADILTLGRLLELHGLL